MPEYPWIIYRMSEGPLTVKEVHQGVNEQLNRKLGTDWGYSEYEWANLLQGFRPLPIRTASGTIAHFSDGAEDVPMKSVVANIVPIQSGTGTPSPSNPRPISGTNVLNVVQNASILNLDKWCEANGVSYSFKNGTFELSTVQGMYAPDYRITDTDTELTFKVDDITSTATNFRIQILNEANQIVASLNSSTKEATVTACKVRMNWSSVGSLSITNLVCYKGSSVKPNTTYTFDLGQEIMGGSADIVGGVGSITRIKKRLLHTDNWGTAQNAFYLDNFFTDMPSTFATSKQNPKCECNIYIENDVVNYSGNVNDRDNQSFFNQLSPYQERLWVKDDRFSTLADFLDFLENNDVHIAYPLATPTEYTFTGQPINSLLGVNNVYTDSGEVLDVEYRSNF